MNVLVIGSFPLCGILCDYLLAENHLKAVCVEKEKYTETQLLDWEKYFKQLDIPLVVINKEVFSDQLKNICLKYAIELVFVCGFSVKIPKQLLAIPKHGFLNIHFGKLPVNRGADPIFWTLKNKESSTAISIFKMDTSWDTGEILIDRSLPVIFGETWGMLNSKMTLKLPELVKKALELVLNTSNYKKQNEELVTYNNRPSENDLSIQWETQTSDEIEALINACNPKYQGATTYYQGGAVKILEVSAVDYPTPLFGRIPGEIIHAHPQEGLFVCCKYGSLVRINILSTDAGTLTGAKYVNIGVSVGQQFTSKPDNTLKKEIASVLL